MKTRTLTWKARSAILIACALFATFATLPAAGATTNDLAAALQKGLFEEEANRNLAEAIKAYQAATVLFDQDRKLAATAVFRMAECYRKQGNTNEALAQYQRVVREFADQPEVNTLSRQAALSLGGTAVESAVAGTGAGTRKEEADEIARIAEMIRNSPDLINARGLGGVTPLYQAAYKGQVAVAQYLLDNGADVNSSQGGDLSESSSRTPLHGAAENGHRAMVELLLNRKADVNAADKRGTTALHLAAQQGFKTVAEVLLAHGADVNARDGTGQSPLHYAAGTGNKVAELLLAHMLARGAAVDPVDNGGETPLHYAAKRGNKELIQLLLDRKANINARNQLEATPLLLALTARQTESARTLLARKADPNLAGSVSWQGAIRKETLPVTMAILIKDDESLELLLKSGAKPNTESAQGAGRPLDLAVSMNRPSAAALLLKNGADPNLPVPPGNFTPLRVAIVNQARELVELLLKFKADPNAKDINGNPQIHAAVQTGDKGLVELLLDYKANIELENAQKWTALSLACANAQREIVELLLSRGANPNTSSSGRTPLADVTQRGWNSSAQARASYEAIAALLRQHGAADDVPQLDRIEIRRPSAKFTQTIFYKGTNGWNQFTLFDLVAVHYGFASASTVVTPFRAVFERSSSTARGALAFPDLANVTILRPGQGGRGRSPVKADLLSLLSRQYALLPCQDLALEWGDVVEIPELDHPLTAAWTGFTPEQLARLNECQKRSIDITVKGQVTNLVLTLQIGRPNNPNVREYPDKAEWAVPQFSLAPVLNQSGLIRASSDLTRVRVRRSDSSGGGREWVIDCTKDSASDLWLRDGDQIEVPEK